MGRPTAAQMKWLAELGVLLGTPPSGSIDDQADVSAGDDEAVLAAAAAADDAKQAERLRRRRSSALDDIESELRLLRRSFA